MAFREISVEQLKDNPFTLINKDWMLITAGDGEKHNTMTASWGGVGELWGKYVSTIYIRPQRYTLEFVEREVDKDAATGLTPCFDQAAPYYEQARLVFLCRKLYRQDMEESAFLDKGLLKKWYDNDLHRIFIGEIVKVLEKE